MADDAGSGTGDDARGADATDADPAPDAGDRRERSYRGISLRAATRYLEGLGGEAGAAGGAGDDGAATDATAVVAGEGWRATLSADAVTVGPSLQLTEVTVVFEGDPETLDALVEEFSRKALRAGG